MISLTVTNSASGAGVTEIVDENRTVYDIIDDPTFASYLVGNQIMFNGGFVVRNEMNQTLAELGCNMNGRNILSALKPANGNNA